MESSRCRLSKKNYVFVDEVGFHAQMIRGRAWSKKGDPAVVKVHTQKGVNISIVGYIVSFGIIEGRALEKKAMQHKSKRNLARK